MVVALLSNGHHRSEEEGTATPPSTHSRAARADRYFGRNLGTEEGTDSMIVGQGEHRYEVVEGWERLPNGWSHGDVAGVATDSQDRVYVFNRSDHPVIIYERDGRFLGSWGEGVFTRPHGITITADDI